MPSIRPQISIDFDSWQQLADAAIEAAAESVEEFLHQMGREMVAEAVQIVRAELPTTDHKKYEAHLENSFTYHVQRGPGEGGEPWTVYLTSQMGADSGKVWALNYGSDGGTKTYTIYPRNAPEALEFSGPGTDYSFSYGKGKYEGRVFRPYAVRTVTTGPREGVFFLERARDEVAQRYGVV